MLSRPFSLGQSEPEERDKLGMAPPSDPAPPPVLPLAQDSSAAFSLAEDLQAALPLNAGLPLAKDSNAGLPLAEDSNSASSLATDSNSASSLATHSNTTVSSAEDSNTGLSLAEDSNTGFSLAEDSNSAFPLADDLNAGLPLAEAWTQTDSSSSSCQGTLGSPMPAGPCVLCSAVLPRLVSSLLSLHQKEMRLLVEGAVASFERRLSALERRFGGEGAEPGESGQPQQRKRRRRREEKETRRKRRRREEEEERGGEGQSESSVCAVAGRNGLSGFSPAEPVGAGMGRGWGFSDSAPRCRRRADLTTVTSWLLMSSPGHAPVRLPWRLSVFALERAVGVSFSDVTPAPERPLQDHSAPPYISYDHSYVRLSVPSLVISARRQQRHRANHSSRRRTFPLPALPTNGLMASLGTAQSAASSTLPGNKRDVKRVSQIRIRRASPKETNLTPLGLPRIKRLKKKEFSLEEIYTNKNYKSPSANSSSLETIFEEPREKDGALLLIGQQRRRRVLHFPDFTQPRKRKRPLTGVGLVAMVPRKRAAARRGCRDDDCDSDVMLLERLSALHDFFQRQGLDQDS